MGNLPYRSECTCPCHVTGGIHMRACCRPDPRMTPTNDAPVTVEQIREDVTRLLQVARSTRDNVIRSGGEQYGQHFAGLNIAADALSDRLAALASAPAEPFPLSDAERAALQKIMQEQELSAPAVWRQALRSYQMDHERRKAGETVTWSGDAERAREFAGPLASAPAGDGVEEAAFKEGIATGYQCGKADEATTDEWHAAWLASDASVAAALARPRAAVGERDNG